MSLNWQKLRAWNGSQNAAFEALCCQLGAYEKAPEGSIFIRKAPPDAGVECYWKLPNGDEWGWQAKFFLFPPDKSQWQQIDESVKTALQKHPQITSYTICLPIDRQDPRIGQQKWFMDKWNEHLGKWTGWTQAKGISVEFNYWGEHEIFERLSREEHRGRCFFWFNEELFSQQWFGNRIEEAVANVGPRYTPELNIELPIAQLFDGLGRSTEFYERLMGLYSEIKKAKSKAHSERIKELIKDELKSLEENMGQLLSYLIDVEKHEIAPTNFELVTKLAVNPREGAWKCIESLEKAADEAKKKAASSREQEVQNQDQKSYNPPEDFGYQRHHLGELVRHLTNLKEFAESNQARLANVPALLLLGDAGTGKTHLFCDVAKQRIHFCLSTILLLGGQFKDEEPWSQIIRLLGLSCNREEFLGALEAAAQLSGSRALILIDALNEGEGKKLWNKHLAGMLTTLSRFPWVGIAVSVRTSYERTVIPDGLLPSRLIRETHHGFADHEYQATRTFFDHFGIEHPSIPVLVPEYQNPLFLKLFCQGLKNCGLRKVPSGLRGITAVLNFFIESVNDKLSRPEYLDFDPKSQIVHKAVERLVGMMANKACIWLPHDDAQAAVNSFLPRDEYEKSLFRHLISEGLLAEDRFRIGDEEWCEGIHFSYERFTDNLIAKHLLDKDLNPENPAQAFQSEQVLGSFIKDERACWRNRGIVEAFSIQLPERIKKELVEIAPACLDFRPVQESFIQSLIWREPLAFTESTLRYINEHIIRYQDTHDQFLNTLLTVASNPEHPYNAEFLHGHLTKFELAERDAWWSIFLHEQYQYEEHGPVCRLIDWAWSREDRSHIGDESIRLCGIVLTWFLTTSNRFLRDRATKALVSLLEKRIHVLREVIHKFINVNDPYVLERLFAVAYGCAMRSMDNDGITALAMDIYESVFKDGTPAPHILLRDYARGIMELAMHRGNKLEVDATKIRPPYRSDWPSFEIPTKEELKKYDEWQKEMPEEEWARVHLYNSVMGSEDFARYIIGTNFGRFKWSSRRLGERRKPTRKEIYQRFVKSLKGKQKEAWEQFHTIRMNADFYRRADQSETKEIYGREFAEEEIRGAITVSEQAFRKTLCRKRLKLFEEYVIPYLDDPDPYKDEYRFDLSIAQRWIFKKVLNLGWTTERFGRFDRKVNRHSGYGRGSRKPERIGKKYQWIAYYEFLARVSDNFEFRGDSWSRRTEKYEGTWQLRRDIDPSFLLSKTGREEWEPHTNTWWFLSSYDAWDIEPDDIKWLKSSKDLPSIEPLLSVMNPEDGSKWLILEAFYNWEQPTPPGEDRFEIPRREIWYMIKSYIVKKSNMEELFDWAKRQDFSGRWMPESDELYNVFFGEFFWAPAFEYHNIPYYYHDGWTLGHDNRIPKKVLVSTDQYMQERGGYDCSINETINVHLPSKWIADKMALRWNGVEGHFFNEKGDLIAFDPSVRTRGPAALLMNQYQFLTFLNENGYDILWTILGEKNMIGGGMSHKEWKGRLELSGAFRIRENRLEGAIKTRFRSRD
jgi:hypothetical protein